jgi:phosphatidate cytidylyltransferase
MVAGVVAIYLARCLYPEYALHVLTIVVFVTMFGFLIMFERGRDQAPLEFMVSASGMVYLGWIGAYMIDLRQIPDGVWWFFLVFGSIWAADIGAYFTGKSLGRHKFFPRSSPKKTWEGYFGGVAAGLSVGILLVLIWSRIGAFHLDLCVGALVGLLISILVPFGDLGVSMFKRQGALKDSGPFLPGHGGFLDRIDTWLWGAALGYFLVTWFLI